MRAILMTSLWLLATLGICRQGLAESASDMCQRMASRRGEITSGSWAYTRTSGVKEVASSHRKEAENFALSNEKWKLSYPGENTSTVINLENKNCGLFGRVRMGKKDWSLHIENPKAADKAGSKPGAVYIGTLWHRSTTDYVLKKASSAKLVGEEKVNGAKCQVIELEVKGDDIGNAWSGINKLLLEGYTLRLYCSPEWGYVVPRIELISKEGVVACRVDSLDFEKHSDVWVAKKFTCQYFDPKPAWFEEIVIHSVETVNKPVPIEVFSGTIPAGTSVSDSRDIHRARGSFNFILSEPKTIATIDDEIARLSGAKLAR